MPFFFSSPASQHRQGADLSLREWYASLLGQSMLPLLGEQVGVALKGVFGYRGLQFGAVGLAPKLIEGSGIYHALLADDLAGADSQLVAAPDALPVASGRLDLLVLFHTLDFHPEPHPILREADRVLADDGHLVVVGFNPRGVWAPARLALRWHRRLPWGRVGQAFEPDATPAAPYLLSTHVIARHLGHKSLTAA